LFTYSEKIRLAKIHNQAQNTVLAESLKYRVTGKLDKGMVAISLLWGEKNFGCKCCTEKRTNLTNLIAH
jgi:hypothetical protein